jgi:phosphatidylserine synthase
LLGGALFAGFSWFYAVATIALFCTVSHRNTIIRSFAAVLALVAIILQSIQMFTTTVTVVPSTEANGKDEILVEHNIFVDISAYVVHGAISTYSLVSAVRTIFKDNGHLCRVGLSFIAFGVNFLSVVGACLATFAIVNALNSTVGGWILTGASTIAMYEDIVDGVTWGWERVTRAWKQIVKAGKQLYGTLKESLVEAISDLTGVMRAQRQK